MASQLALNALANLTLPQYSGIRAVFGSVFEKRCALPDPDWGWVNDVANRIPLETVNAICSRYVSLIAEPDARLKCEADLLGRAARCPSLTFQGFVGDFFAEVAAVTELAKRGFSEFKAVQASCGAKAYDYSARFEGKKVCIEVKHLRSPRTVIGFFMELMRSFALQKPNDYQFSLEVEYPSDNTASEDQEREVSQFLAGLAGAKAPFTTNLIFSDGSVARLTAHAGSCMAFGSRTMHIDEPERFKVERVLNKIKEKTEHAVAQMAVEDCLKVLVININSPWAELEQKHFEAAADIVRTTSKGMLQPFFLHYYHFVDVQSVGPT